MNKDNIIEQNNKELKDLLENGKFELSMDSQTWIDELNRLKQERRTFEEQQADTDFANMLAIYEMKRLNDMGERLEIDAMKDSGMFDKPSEGLEDIREQIVQEHQRAMGVDFSKYPDTRYNVPKGNHKASDEAINKAIKDNEIYKEAKEWILGAQMGQVGYGLDKYPETLQESSWTILETLDHIIQESVDKLHYEVMLRIKIARMLDESMPKERTKEHEECIKNAEDIKEMTDDILESLKDPNLLNEKE